MHPLLSSTLILVGLGFAHTVHAQGFQTITNIPYITGSGQVTLQDFITAVYFLAITIAGLIAVVKIIFAGVKYMLSDVVTNKESAKKDIRGALLGLLIVIGAVFILTIINPDLTRTQLGEVRVIEGPVRPPNTVVVGQDTGAVVQDILNNCPTGQLFMLSAGELCCNDSNNTCRVSEPRETLLQGFDPDKVYDVEEVIELLNNNQGLDYADLGPGEQTREQIEQACRDQAEGRGRTLDEVVIIQQYAGRPGVGETPTILYRGVCIYRNLPNFIYPQVVNTPQQEQEEIVTECSTVGTPTCEQVSNECQDNPRYFTVLWTSPNEVICTLNPQSETPPEETPENSEPAPDVPQQPNEPEAQPATIGENERLTSCGSTDAQTCAQEVCSNGRVVSNGVVMRGSGVVAFVGTPTCLLLIEGEQTVGEDRPLWLETAPGIDAVTTQDLQGISEETGIPYSEVLSTLADQYGVTSDELLRTLIERADVTPPDQETPELPVEETLTGPAEEPTIPEGETVTGAEAPELIVPGPAEAALAEDIAGALAGDEHPITEMPDMLDGMAEYAAEQGLIEETVPEVDPPIVINAPAGDLPLPCIDGDGQWNVEWCETEYCTYGYITTRGITSEQANAPGFVGDPICIQPGQLQLSEKTFIQNPQNHVFTENEIDEIRQSIQADRDANGNPMSVGFNENGLWYTALGMGGSQSVIDGCVNNGGVPLRLDVDYAETDYLFCTRPYGYWQ